VSKPELDKEVSEILSTPVRGNHAQDWQLIGRCNDFIEDKDNPRGLRKKVLRFVNEVVMGCFPVSEEALDMELDREEGDDE
jgi:hypothetical protein